MKRTLLACALVMASSAQGQDDFSMDIVEEAVTDTDSKKMEDAKDMAAQERFGEALGAFEQMLADPKLKKYHQEADYELAKTLYKMGAYHAALDRFEKILAVGPKHPFFAQSREWVFFTARKVKDELAALSLIAKYAKLEDIPAEYQSELGYALGRYYFLTALDLGAKGVEVDVKEVQEDQSVDPPVDGADDKKEDKPADDKKEEEGFNFSDESLGGGDVDLVMQDDDDDFGFGDATVSDDPKDKGKKGKKGKKKKPEKAPEAKDATPTDAGGKTDAKEPEKSKAEPAGPKHAFMGPKKSDEALKLCLSNLERVKPEFAFYAQARYIKGLCHYTKGDFNPAVKEFREVVRMTNPNGGTVDNPRLREMAFFSLARIHYQFEQFRYAIFYYDRIDRDSEQWLESLFESSWAHFRLGEYEKALGNLVTLQSPFFQDEYYPESSILKAITFYENCRYPEAKAFLGEFKQSYDGVRAELDRLVGDANAAETSKDPNAKAQAKNAEQLFNELVELEQKVKDGQDDQNRKFALTARLLRLALSDKRVKGYRDAITEVEEEKARIQALSPPFSGGQTQQELLAANDKRREELVNLAGTLLKDKLLAERAFLNDLTAKLIRIRFEITKGEKEAEEAALSGKAHVQNYQDYKFTTATDDERLYWPFEGEYWRDELGTYQYTLTKGCRPPEETTITGD